MRILAIGDIHGCSKALHALLAAVQPKSDDLLVTLGDYVDRGPDAAGVIQQLLRLRKNHRLVALRGNHELMMTAARYDKDHFREWLACGGKATLASYAILDDDGKMVDVPDEHWDFIEEKCVDWHETDRHFFVHANAYADLPLSEQPAFMLFWEKFHEPAPHVSGKVMVCGHTPQKDGRPLSVGHAVCIDTWCHGGSWLTCLDVVSGRVWQGNQAAKTRAFWLDGRE